MTDEDIIDGGDFTGSFDFGDVSHIIPTLHPMFGGVKVLFILEDTLL